MGFFKKFIGIFREEAEIDTELRETNKQSPKGKLPKRKKSIEPAASFPKAMYNPPDLKTKVTYRYPSTERRLSTDDSDTARARRDEFSSLSRRLKYRGIAKPAEAFFEADWEQEEVTEQDWKARNTTATPPATPPVAPPATPSVSKTTNRAFRPTDIPSPVYGFGKRELSGKAKAESEVPESPNKEDHSVNIDERTEEPVVTPAKETPEQEKEREEIVIRTQKQEEQQPNVSEEAEEAAGVSPDDKQSEEEDTLLVFKTAQEKKTVFDVEKEDPAFREKIEESEVKSQPEPASLETREEKPAVKAEESAVTPPSAGKKLQKKKQEERHKARQEARRKKGRVTPFNVIMSMEDRKAWESRQAKQQAQPIEPAKQQELGDSLSSESQPAEEAAAPKHQETEVLAEDHKQQEETVLAVEEQVYAFPDVLYLAPPVMKKADPERINIQSNILNETFRNFNVKASVVDVTVGPSVMRFEVEPERGVKVSKITNLADDIKRSLAARTIRIEAPIPGTQVIGIEIPNKDSRPVQISEIISTPEFTEHTSPLASALGLDISGEPVVLDLNKMPHGLIAGATGSGKSVCINSILVSLLYKAAPHELKLLLIDPKMVELAPYNDIPHLVSPVITDVKAATAALKWAVEEMERRYELFLHAGVRDIKKYNEKVARRGKKGEHLPYIVIVIDELADLMMMSPSEVEEAISRIAQKARACGIHLIVATQRPSVDVITGLIKANIPTRIAFSVSSQVDSRTIIDTGGAEKLLGRGDMLLLNNGASEAVRLQGTFVSDDEIDMVVEHVRKQQAPNYLFRQEELLEKAQIQETEDELFPEACEFVVQKGGASTSLLQRHFSIGYNRAARLIEMMETQGMISGQRAGKPREVLMTEEDLQALKEAHMN